jgi:hypothetical protein
MGPCLLGPEKAGGLGRPASAGRSSPPTSFLNKNLGKINEIYSIVLEFSMLSNLQCRSRVGRVFVRVNCMFMPVGLVFVHVD